MSGELQFYLVATAAVILFGLSKGGFSGLGTLGVPMLSLVASRVRAAAIVLPILIVQDWVSVWAFRRDFRLAISSSSFPRRRSASGSAGCLRRGSATTRCGWRLG
jgi:hypothetical protein